jgi:hypothetical protein
MEVIGHDLDGAEITLGDVLGAAAGAMVKVNKPGWRKRALTNGVQAAQEGMVPLALTPQTNGGTFTSAISAIEWIGRMQKPYRAERMLVTVARVGASATAPRLLGQIFVGVDLQMATRQAIDIEVFGNPTAFGTRMTLFEAAPGVELAVPVVLSTNLTAPDTIFATVQFSGRVVH